MPLSPIPGTLVFGRRRIIKALRPSSGFPIIPPIVCPPESPWGNGKVFTASVRASFVANTFLANREFSVIPLTSFTITVV